MQGVGFGGGIELRLKFEDLGFRIYLESLVTHSNGLL